MSLLVCLIFSNGFLSPILHFIAVFLSLFKSFFTSCSQCVSFVLLSISMDYRGILSTGTAKIIQNTKRSKFSAHI